MLGDVLSGKLVNEILWVEGIRLVGRGAAGGRSGLELMGGVSVGDVWYTAVAVAQRRNVHRLLAAKH